ncbi:thiamine pyrophosphate-binding protein, partial [Aerococcus sp. L_32]|uniref:thiamine pyrophosphate-binding protein n=1 Tax=Aerococcus sp. L_32 TaxID=3422316 RepID=UPI003D6B2138
MERTKKTSVGTELLVNALRDQGAEIIFGYPGGAALHIYDEFFRQNVNHVLARH